MREALAAVRELTDFEPDVAMTLGSGLGALADTFDDATRISYEKLPGLPVSTVKGHAGELVLGTLGGTRCVVMKGRVHRYEGHGADTVVFGVRLMASLGARAFVVTNAAGGISAKLAPGDLMLITDQLNLTGVSPLFGHNDDALGPRFPDMSEPFDRELGELALRHAEAHGGLKQGVYSGVNGPQYETPAEVRMLRTLGGDAVGMSTVLEVIAARHLGLRTLGISCITNIASGLSDEALDHADVTAVAAEARGRFQGLVRAVVADIPALLR